MKPDKKKGTAPKREPSKSPPKRSSAKPTEAKSATPLKVSAQASPKPAASPAKKSPTRKRAVLPARKVRPVEKAATTNPAPVKSPESAAIQIETPAQSKAPPRPRKVFAVPPILLEGDAPAPLPASGPGTRYALTAETLLPQVTATSGELPESYGTQSLFLAARDPRWLFASWDLSDEQQRAFNRRSRSGNLALKIFVSGESKPAIPEVQVHPESRSWFVNVPHAEKLYYAELGFYDSARKWVSIATSKSTFTPPDSPSPEIAQDFATIPPDVTFQQIVQAVQSFVTEHEPLLEAVIRAGAERRQTAERTETELMEQRPTDPGRSAEKSSPHQEPQSQSVPVHEMPVTARPNGMIPKRSFRAELPVRVERRDGWSRDQAKAVARLINVDSYRRVWMGSLEITELIRRRLQEEISSIAAAELSQSPEEQESRRGVESAEGAPSSLFVPEAPGKARGFWFKVNAELIIYGATEPDATVTIAERSVKLRPDGTFSFRFSLPDGRYQLPAIAISKAGDDGREARLEFSRSTEYRGRVEVHPQDASLRPPKPESIG